MIDQFYYNEQFKNYILQFCAIFAGLKVQTGIGQTGTTEFIDVPIRHASMDRVAQAIATGNTQNRPLALPLMSASIVGVELAPERRKGVSVVDKKTVLPIGGVFPDDLKVQVRVMPIPYNLTFELALYASNNDQMYQILEQILMIFDPILQIQTTDAPADWTKLTTVALESIQSEENFPPGAEKRLIVWTMNFTMPVWITPPMDIRNEVVKKVITRIGDLNGFVLDEYDANGDLQPFTTVYSTTTVQG